jgi:DNA-binding transcriptional MerR regulator
LSNTTYTIQMASKISGVGVHTIRAWEKRYKALEPIRDASGHRTYSKVDIEKLMLLSELCLLGYTISKVAGLDIPELKNLLKDLGKTEESLAAQDFNLINDTKLTVDASQSLPILTFALKSYKLDIVNIELGKLKLLLSARDFALEILLPLANLLSDLHTSGSFNSDQEKIVRSILKFHQGHQLYHPTERKDKSNVNIIVSGMEGDLNDVGLGIVGLLCGHYGFHYIYLGADIPCESLLDAAKSFEANLIIIGPSNAFVQMGKAHFQSYINKLLSKLPVTTELVITAKPEFNLDIPNTKRLVYLKDLGAIDDYLAQKK